MNKEMTPEERELYEKVVYWTKDEVDCYNEAIDRCIVVLESFSEGQSIPNQMRLVELKHRFLALKKSNP